MKNLKYLQMLPSTMFPALPVAESELTKADSETPIPQEFATVIRKTGAVFLYSKFSSPTIVFTIAPTAFPENQMTFSALLSRWKKSST